MLAMRAIGRTAPTTLARLSTSAPRQSARSNTAVLGRAAAACSPLRLAQRPSFFSSTALRQGSHANEVDEELSLKLKSELQFETEMKEDHQEQPASIKDFLENSPFELIDEPGKEEVVLKRKFGKETITVTFSINDLTNMDPDVYNDDNSLNDEDNESESRNNPEAEAEEEPVDDEDMDSENSVPCRLNVIVEKEGVPGALNIEAAAQDGNVMVENFAYYKDGKLARPQNPDAAHKAQDTYLGPPFGSLDEDLQILMERYLEERGITQAMAVFVPDYMDAKEQREYNDWLNNVKDFVDA